MKLFTKFGNDETGAVTVDWVVLTAAIVGIAFAVIAVIFGGIENASNGINAELMNVESCTNFADC
jgi:Flp pilus assembly pilin Flp